MGGAWVGVRRGRAAARPPRRRARAAVRPVGGVGVRPQRPRQEIRFCRAPDGVRIAYAVHGTGPPMVVDSCWLSHLQYDWQSPVWRHYLEGWGRRNTVIRFDERGHGLWDRAA